jgi:surface antigen
LKIKTILLRWLSSKKENIKKIVELLPENSYFRGGAVIFIISAFVFIILTITGSSAAISTIEEEAETTRVGSFVYASQYLNPDEFILEESYTDQSTQNSNILLQDSAVLAVSYPSTLNFAPGGERSGVITYEVQSGDVISEIAKAYNISVNTILWANNLSVWDYIKPGQKLTILPVSGILHTVKKGETLKQIVNSYKADIDKTIDFNGLPANGTLAIGQQIVVPDGQRAYSPTTARSYATNASYGSFPRPYATQSHQFPWGQCTWYVAQRRYIPWGGNAKTWIYQASQYGLTTGNEPQVGAIIQTRENSYYGHVAYVEAVEGDYVTISEMHLGQGIKKIRTLRIDDWRIVGYIY